MQNNQVKGQVKGGEGVTNKPGFIGTHMAPEKAKHDERKNGETNDPYVALCVAGVTKNKNN